jgi:predicted aspartyl protease
MPTADCGLPTAGFLEQYGPTLQVEIGLDAVYSANASTRPNLQSGSVLALVDTGALESCIDSELAAQLGLPIVDRQHIAGVGGSIEVNVHLAQIYIPALNYTIYGTFAGVHLNAGGQPHVALIGRTFLRHHTMTYDGRSGSVTISND